MKKVKIIAGAILRGALLLAPGAIFCSWAWGKAMALIAILASVGLEALFLLLFAFVSVAVQARRDLRRKEREEADAKTESEL